METILSIDGILLTRSDDLFCLRMNRSENVINPEMVNALEQMLGELTHLGQTVLPA